MLAIPFKSITHEAPDSSDWMAVDIAREPGYPRVWMLTLHRHKAVQLKDEISAGKLVTL